MGFVLLVVRPVFTIWSRGLVNLSIGPSLAALVRWRSYRYVLRQSLGFFQNDYAGRISQKVMQTGMALRESVVNVIDGVWYLIVYLLGTVTLLAGFDWRLLLPLIAWLDRLRRRDRRRWCRRCACARAPCRRRIPA